MDDANDDIIRNAVRLNNNDPLYKELCETSIGEMIGVGTAFCDFGSACVWTEERCDELLELARGVDTNILRTIDVGTEGIEYVAVLGQVATDIVLTFLMTANSLMDLTMMHMDIEGIDIDQLRDGE